MTNRKSAIAALAAAMVFSLGASGATRQELLDARAAVKSGDGARLGSKLMALETLSTANRSSAAVSRMATHRMPGLRASNGYVSISAYGDDLPALRTQLVAKGLLNAKLHATAVTGRAPISALADMAKTPGLKFARPTLAMTRAGTVQTQGDRSLRAERARAESGATGKGIRVGVLSDSYDCNPGAFEEGAPFTRAAQDIANNDLPRDVLLLKDLDTVPNDGCSDEGRAMMQLIHDVAPGASQAFYTAFESQEDFAAGIRALANAGSKVIVDDIIYFAEPMFEDGIIAQAVDDVYKAGVAYFSAAGNDARHSYESRFRRSGALGISGPLHDFSPGAGIDGFQSVTVGPQSDTLLVVQWDQPFLSSNGRRGATTDMDIYYYDQNGDPIIPCIFLPEDAPLICQFPGWDVNIGGDAVEFPELINFTDDELQVQIGMEVFEGPAPNFLKYVWFDFGEGVFEPNEYDTHSGTVYGHANAKGAEAVGASAWYQTEEWGSPLRPQCFPACLNSFSSAGGVPILFDLNGNRLRAPEVRTKPGVTGPDGGNTTFFIFDLGFEVPGTNEPDGFPNFFGTSASAPHVAAVAALMLDQRARDIAARKRFNGPKNLTPDLVFRALRLTADEMKLRNFGGDIGPQPVDNANGFDLDTGFGFVDAQRALRSTRGF